MGDEPAKQAEAPFDSTRRDSKRAQRALNALVIFSAVAGSVFFFYVLITISPFGPKKPDNVEVPTSSVADRYGLLVGTDVAGGLGVALRDIDEAPEYRDRLSDTMRGQLGIGGAGRMYLLTVRNDGADTQQVSLDQLTVTDKAGGAWTVRWLEQAANPQTAGPTGRLRLTQSARRFELPKGAERQVYVFIEGAPPPAEEFTAGELQLAGGLRVKLSHTEMKTQ